MFEETFSYDDVLLVPGYSEILPRETDVSTVIAGDISLNVPVISAAMDTVTEERMAVAIALQGGAGRHPPQPLPSVQAEQVAAVKRYLNWIIENPVTVEADRTLRDVRAHHGVPARDGPAGRRRSRASSWASSPRATCASGATTSPSCSDAMTSRVVVERPDATPASARAKFDEHRIEKLPVVDDDGQARRASSPSRTWRSTSASPRPRPTRPAASS